MLSSLDGLRVAKTIAPIRIEHSQGRCQYTHASQHVKQTARMLSTGMKYGSRNRRLEMSAGNLAVNIILTEIRLH
jgi:hypothetical protein